jgi:hypothetical protein
MPQLLKILQKTININIYMIFQNNLLGKQTSYFQGLKPMAVKPEVGIIFAARRLVRKGSRDFRFLQQETAQ